MNCSFTFDTVLKHTKDGVLVEMYDALAANRDILKIEGRFEENNKQKAPVFIDYTKLSKGALAEVLDATKPE